MMDWSGERTMDMEQFVAFMFNVFACLSELHSFHYLANAMTISACHQDVTDQDIKQMFQQDDELYPV